MEQKQNNIQMSNVAWGSIEMETPHVYLEPYKTIRSGQKGKKKKAHLN